MELKKNDPPDNHVRSSNVVTVEDNMEVKEDEDVNEDGKDGEQRSLLEV